MKIEIEGLKLDLSMDPEKKAEFDRRQASIDRETTKGYAAMMVAKMFEMVMYQRANGITSPEQLGLTPQQSACVTIAQHEGIVSGILAMGIVAGYITEEEAKAVAPEYVTPIWATIRGVVTSFDLGRDTLRMEAGGMDPAEAIAETAKRVAKLSEDGSVETKMAALDENGNMHCMCEKCRARRKNSN